MKKIKSLFEQELDNRIWAKRAIHQVISEFGDGKRSHTSAIDTLYKIAYDFHKPSLTKAREELEKKRVIEPIKYHGEFYVSWSDIKKVIGDLS